MDTTADRLARNLRRLRSERGWTIGETAEITGFHPSLLEGIETGRSFLGPSALVHLARRLDVPLHELTDAGPAPAPPLLPPDVAG